MDNYSDLFSQGGLSLDRLRNFGRIAEAGGLSKAAGGNPGRMSLYSRQVRDLQGFFGVDLTRRRGRRLDLTEAGGELARLVRAQLLGLEDFRRRARKQPLRVRIGAGNSIVEWLLVPRLAPRMAKFRDLEIEIISVRTLDTVAEVRDLRLDCGIVRQDAAPSSLRSRRLLSIGYSLFLPRGLAAGITKANLPRKIGRLPLATAMGGKFREALEEVAARAKMPLRIALGCMSFTQAARAVTTGRYGAILPDIAASDFPDRSVQRFPLDPLRLPARPLCLIWNPRLVEMRPRVGELLDAIAQALTS